MSSCVFFYSDNNSTSASASASASSSSSGTSPSDASSLPLPLSPPVPPQKPVTFPPPVNPHLFFSGPFTNSRRGYVHFLQCDPAQFTFTFNAKEESTESDLLLEYAWSGMYCFDKFGEMDFYPHKYESLENGERATMIDVTPQVKEWTREELSPSPEIVLAGLGMLPPLVTLILAYGKPQYVIRYFAPEGSLTFIGKLMNEDLFVRFPIPSEDCLGFRRFCGESLTKSSEQGSIIVDQ